MLGDDRLNLKGGGINEYPCCVRTERIDSRRNGNEDSAPKTTQEEIA